MGSSSPDSEEGQGALSDLVVVFFFFLAGSSSLILAMSLFSLRLFMSTSFRSASMAFLTVSLVLFAFGLGVRVISENYMI